MKKIDVDKAVASCSSIRPVMFDRYAGDNETELKPEEKFYFAKDGKTLVVPSQNILGMLSSNLYKCATKIKYGRSHGAKSDAVQGFVDIDPVEVTLTKNGKPIVFKDFKQDGIYVDFSVARIKKSAGVMVPNPKHRPVIETWGMKFTVTVLPNDVIDLKAVKELIEIGGLYIGIGTWRGRYGKFVVDSWK